MLCSLLFFAWAINTVTAFLAGGPVLIGACVALACELLDLEEDATMRRCWRKTNHKKDELKYVKNGHGQGQVLDNLIMKN